jgi:uncharacterized membrane protein (GlpM family)
MSPEFMFWIGLVLKMAMTAAVVVGTSVVVERSGSFLGALIASLPTAAGAAYIILAVEHPRSFIAASAVGSIASAATVSVFCATYTLLAQRRGLILSLGCAVLAWFAAASALRLATWTPLSAVGLDIVVFGVAIPLSSRYRAAGPPAKFLRTKYDIPLRALAAALVVVVVTTASYSIGSFASGVFALFPIILGSSIVVLHPRVGGKATASMTAHAQVALIGLALGFLAVHFLTEPLGSWWALAAGLLVCVAWSGVLWLARARSVVRIERSEIRDQRII